MRNPADYITVEVLIKNLQKLNPNSLVVLSCDEEGNGFMPLHSLEQAQASELDFQNDVDIPPNKTVIIMWPW
jgi:hypothetical protein